MCRTTLLIRCILGALLVGAPATAGSIHVAPSGDDASPGTAESPLKTIQRGADIAQAGDTIVVAAGTYNERVVTKSSGLAGSPITFEANGTVQMNGFRILNDHVAVDGFTISTNGPNLHGLEVSGDFATILNNTIKDILGDLSKGISFALSGGAQNALVKGNTFIGPIKSTVVELAGTDHVLEENDIGFMDSTDAIRAFGEGHIIRKNYIHDFTTNGFHVDIFQTFGASGLNANNILIEQNRFTNIDGQCFMIEEHGQSISDISFRNNVFDTVAHAGQTYAPRTNFYNNTFRNVGWTNSWSISFRKGVKGDSSGSKVHNNIFADTGNQSTNGWYHIDAGASITTDYNLVFPSKSGFAETNGLNGADPCFVDDQSSDLRLLPCSGAIGAAVTLASFSNDIDDNSRVAGSWDIGAYESQESPQAPSPPTGLRIRQ